LLKVSLFVVTYSTFYDPNLKFAAFNSDDDFFNYF